MNYERLTRVLERHEGRRARPYTDTLGNTTIGVGRNLSAVGLSEVEIALLLANDIQAAEALLDSRAAWWRQLDDVRQEALVNMAFNMGNRLFTFRTALRLLESQDYAGAAKAFLTSSTGGRSLWYKQVRGRAVEVTHAIARGQWATHA